MAGLGSQKGCQQGEVLSCSSAPAKNWQQRSRRGHQPWWDAAALLQGHGAIIHALLCLYFTLHALPGDR